MSCTAIKRLQQTVKATRLPPIQTDNDQITEEVGLLPLCGTDYSTEQTGNSTDWLKNDRGKVDTLYWTMLKHCNRFQRRRAYTILSRT